LKLGRVLDKPTGLNDANKAMFNDIGKAAGAEFIVARGSRVKGYWIDSSDYDCVIWMPSSKSKEVQDKLKEFMKQNNIKIDAQVNDKATATDGIMLEVNYG
jgi:predicted nucleotidyltransferase